MDMKKCTVIPLIIHAKDLRMYKTVFYTNIYSKTISTNARKMSGKNVKNAIQNGVIKFAANRFLSGLL